MKELTHISLFAGIGGIDIAAEWAGFRTILFVEIDPFCQRVLKKHWPDVPIIGDIRDATKEKVMAHAEGREPGEQEAWNGREDTGGGGQEKVMAHTNIGEGGPRIESKPIQKAQFQLSTKRRVERHNGKSQSISSVTLVTGGFPCQPVSVAGKRRGKKDDRWLWPDMLRVISEVRPTWVVAENVAGLLHMGFYDCLSDLEGEGYETVPFVIPACAVNAPHRRNRIFIIAFLEYAKRRASCLPSDVAVSINDRGGTPRHTENRKGEENNEGREGRSQLGIGGCGKDVADTIIGTPGTAHRTRGDKGRANSKQDDRDSLGDDFRNSSKDAPDTEGKRLERANTERATQPWGCPPEYLGSNWWAVEPELGRVAYGISNRVDRLKALGNAVVPQQIYPILKAIADIERKFMA
ncbi:hypothetical protein ES705_12495 [subsurface metagenome]